MHRPAYRILRHLGRTDAGGAEQVHAHGPENSLKDSILFLKYDLDVFSNAAETAFEFILIGTDIDAHYQCPGP